MPKIILEKLEKNTEKNTGHFPHFSITIKIPLSADSLMSLTNIYQYQTYLLLASFFVFPDSIVPILFNKEAVQSD